MTALPTRNKKILLRKIRSHKKRCFPGKGGGVRLAAETGVPPQTVSDWITGSRTPTFGQLYQLAKAFNVSPLELCGIQETDGVAGNTADTALLRSLLDVLEYTIEYAAAPTVAAKTMESVNHIVIKEMEEMDTKSENYLM